MSQALDTASQGSSGPQRYLLAAYYLVAGNLSLATVGFGVLLVALGGALVWEPLWEYIGQPGELREIFSGMFGIWGATLVVFGLLVYGLFLANKTYARLS